MIILNINIYSDYNVEILTKGCTLDVDGFRDFEYSKIEVLNGGDLLELLSEILSEQWLSSLNIDSQNGVLDIEIFNPLTGEGKTNTYKIRLEQSI